MDESIDRPLSGADSPAQEALRLERRIHATDRAAPRVIERVVERPIYRRPVALTIILVAIAALLTIAVALLLLERYGGWPFRRDPPQVALSCPRPDPTTQPPRFGGQQAGIRGLREQAFAGDFFAQLELGRRYQARNDADQNLLDPVEAAVWYAMALTNPSGYAALAGQPQAAAIKFPSPPSLYDSCRAAERSAAASDLAQLWGQMSSDEQQEVRQRLIYVLLSQGAPGFRILARITSSGAGPYGEPLPGAGTAPTGPQVLPVELFSRNDVDSYLYSYLAAQAGDVGGYVMLKDFERASGADYGAFTQAKANRWVPPFEFYPPDAPASGAPHSDESRMDSDAAETALARLDELPFIHVGQALAYLQVTAHPYAHEREAPLQDIRAFQAMIGRPQTGRLTPLEKVRAIQYAAVNGSGRAQLVLAVMYSEGVGVQADYARAYAWYQRASRQGSGEAKFAIANYFSLGVEGVANQDKAEAVVYRLDSAMAGFRPSAGRIRAVLDQVTRKARP